MILKTNPGTTSPIFLFFFFLTRSWLAKFQGSTSCKVMLISLLMRKQMKNLLILMFDYVSSECIFPKFESKTPKRTGLLVLENSE